MIERTPIFNFICYTLLALGMVIALLPFVIVIIASTLDLETVNRVPLPLTPSSHFWENAQAAWIRADLGNKLIHSIIFAAAVGAGKVILSAMAAFSIVYFRFRGRHLIFWIIFITLMLPLEVRIVPTYSIAANALQPFQTILDITGITALVAWVSGIQIKLE